MELIVENVQSYPRPPALEPVAQRVRVVLGGCGRAPSGSEDMEKFREVQDDLDFPFQNR